VSTKSITNITFLYRISNISRVDCHGEKKQHIMTSVAHVMRRII